MNRRIYFSQLIILLLSLICVKVTECQVRTRLEGPKVSYPVADAAAAIVNSSYERAIDKLEQALASTPQDTEAMTYLATARTYQETDYLKAKQYFEEAINKGGGASFVVRHSHEVSMMSLGDPNDYCRGWLHLRKGEARFIADNGEHSVVIPFSEITEFKQNRMPKLFHLKVGKDKNYNFSPRSRDERESLLIVVMYQKLSRK
jgi:tetratricopeptide (TPR) repeat protein